MSQEECTNKKKIAKWETKITYYSQADLITHPESKIPEKMQSYLGTQWEEIETHTYFKAERMTSVFTNHKQTGNARETR